jgi:PKHD-type hydroxylase
MLLHIPEVLTAAELQQINSQLEPAAFVDGRATAGYQSARVKANLQLPEGSPLARQLGDTVLAALERCPQFSSAALPRRIYPPLFSRYLPGMRFGDHVDNTLRGDSQPMRTDLSATLFLSAPQDYDGGELIINDTFGTHHVKLPAGDLLLYPSGSVHRVAEIGRGRRQACFFWIQSLVRDDAQRRMLYQLDQSIIGLHGVVPDSHNQADILRLTHCYHNLLRLWVEV